MSTRKKTRQQHNQGSQPLPQPSDYETDAPTMSTHPPPPPRSNEELNHSVLLRYNPSITSILAIAPYATVYAYSHSTSGWIKSGVEGTIFVCELTPNELGVVRYSVIVLNRRGLENFEVEVKTAESVQWEEPYIMLQDESMDENGEMVVHGLYVFHEDETSTEGLHLQMAKAIQECAERADKSRAQAEVLSAAEMAKQKNGYGKEENNQLDEDEPDSVAMGRQLSLRELFGKQREIDSGWSVKAHQSPATQSKEFSVPSHSTLQQQQQQSIRGGLTSTTQFDMNPETEFFMTGRNFTPQMLAQQQQARSQQGQRF
ncbi:PH domain-like protein [Pseudovirgaria hyperparasitica]|uniref:PH domain-like protein n=1 Tax=Pseudovirgaria hyperparasitica TaxID=470096 RepID=A0A6A6W1D4_9PEZI|nr:PH domain-like protein [Pseudovirgaria hyperparasitica]KAF2755906.1 PH domain-like protein [Pseudovirgaria hyperparasitica]